MSHKDFTKQYRSLGRFSTWAVFCLVILYVPVTALGFLSLKSPQDPIGDPYFSMMELLILLIALLMVMSMVAVHAYAPEKVKACSLTALVFMAIMACITSGLHFVILTVSRPIEAAGLTSAALLFSFKWPSVVYTLDILAWDWFFPISMFFAAPVFAQGRLEKTARLVLIAAGSLSLVGLLGVPLAILNVDAWYNVRNIGIIGYALVAPLAFLLLALIFGRTPPAPE